MFILSSNKDRHVGWMKNPLRWKFKFNGIACCPLKKVSEGGLELPVTAVLVSNFMKTQGGGFKLGILEGANIYGTLDSHEAVSALSRPVTADKLFDEGWRVD